MEQSLLLTQITAQLQAAATEEARSATDHFIPGVQKQYGVRMPVLNEMANTYKGGGWPLVDALWKAGSLEEQLLAAKITGKLARKNPEEALKRVELFSAGIHNWAVCDALGMQSVQPIREKFQLEIFSLAQRLIVSTDAWQRRLALVLVEWYTRQRHLLPDIEALLHTVENDEAYYVQKAVAWVKRNIDKKK